MNVLMSLICHSDSLEISTETYNDFLVTRLNIHEIINFKIVKSTIP